MSTENRSKSWWRSLVPGEVRAAYDKDPALHGWHVIEVLMYQGVWALWVHRLSHMLWRLKVPVVPRFLSQIMRVLTLIEIHPGATIGKECFIDHGAGVVIGETTVLGDHVMLYHGVTLGGHGFWADKKGSKRHPTIEENVTLAVGCSVLGPITIGANSRIGPSAVVYKDVPSDSVVVAASGRYVVERGQRLRRDDDAYLRTDWLES